jgi:hypothetical protein
MLRKWNSLLRHGSRVSKMLLSTLAIFGIVGVAVAVIAAQSVSDHNNGGGGHGQHLEESANCSNATLNGSYGLHATGTVTGVGDFNAVGRFSFDGKGNLTGKLFVRLAGNNMEPPAFTGTYSVSPDCTVRDSWGPPIDTKHVSVIVDEGKGYFILNDTTGSGDTISGQARRE